MLPLPLRDKGILIVVDGVSRAGWWFGAKIGGGSGVRLSRSLCFLHLGIGTLWEFSFFLVICCVLHPTRHSRHDDWPQRHT